MTHRIDVHHHFNPPGSAGGQPGWSASRALDHMDEAGVALAIGWPGPVPGESALSRLAARERARGFNDFGASLGERHPSRFGLFASMPPLTDSEGALQEINHAFDVLKADGIGLSTHYGDCWLGDLRFRPVFEELDRRAAVVFVHPQAHADCGCGTLGYQTAGVSAAWLEYPFNTARCILNLMTTGTLRRFPRIRFVFCHGGGALTSLVGRIEAFGGWLDMGPDRLAEILPEGVAAEFRRLHFECAQACTPEGMALLLGQVPASQVLFGTDYDRFPLRHTVERFSKLALPADVCAAIEHGNARRLFAR